MREGGGSGGPGPAVPYAPVVDHAQGRLALPEVHDREGLLLVRGHFLPQIGQRHRGRKDHVRVDACLFQKIEVGFEKALLCEEHEDLCALRGLFEDPIVQEDVLQWEGDQALDLEREGLIDLLPVGKGQGQDARRHVAPRQGGDHPVRLHAPVGKEHLQHIGDELLPGQVHVHRQRVL